ncbi:hypothetical protein [Streptomyces sp. NBC_01304]|uniref:hypothetical protein n=1 Tax=Streptomyces sp. NBC_01304 TaxID=2903818 RepID=UPI002E104003|nr:hypothetical protein OG430_40780 [Streptomyces sp. NBC_01304]
MCGAQSFTHTVVRAHQGLLFFMRFIKVDEALCRTCGIEMIRTATTQTLWQGWWSPLSLLLFAPFALLSNLVSYRKVRALPPPEPGYGQQALDEGRPVHKRPLAYVGVLPVLWLVWFVHGMATQSI